MTETVLTMICFQLAFQKFERGHSSGKTSSYSLRALLWEAGCTVSNKVLECLVLRFAKNKILTTENYVMALVRLHLAHGKGKVYVKLLYSNRNIFQKGITVWIQK